MAAHSTTRLANGHTLTIVQGERIADKAYRIEERNGLGTFLHVAYAGSLNGCEAWVERAVERGYGLRPTIGRYVNKRTSELQTGDVVNAHGMRCLIDREIRTYEQGGNTVYNTRALVLNRDEVPNERVPVAWTSEKSGEHRWTIQGNDLARWDVEATASERIRAAREARS